MTYQITYKEETEEKTVTHVLHLPHVHSMITVNPFIKLEASDVTGDNVVIEDNNFDLEMPDDFKGCMLTGVDDYTGKTIYVTFKDMKQRITRSVPKNIESMVLINPAGLIIILKNKEVMLYDEANLMVLSYNTHRVHEWTRNLMFKDTMSQSALKRERMPFIDLIDKCNRLLLRNALINFITNASWVIVKVTRKFLEHEEKSINNLRFMANVDTLVIFVTKGIESYLDTFRGSVRRIILITSKDLDYEFNLTYDKLEFKNNTNGVDLFHYDALSFFTFDEIEEYANDFHHYSFENKVFKDMELTMEKKVEIVNTLYEVVQKNNVVQPEDIEDLF